MTDIDWAALVSAVTGFLVAATGALKLWVAKQRKQKRGDRADNGANDDA